MLRIILLIALALLQSAFAASAERIKRKPIVLSYVGFAHSHSLMTCHESSLKLQSSLKAFQKRGNLAWGCPIAAAFLVSSPQIATVLVD